MARVGFQRRNVRKPEPMNRREFLARSAAIAVSAAIPAVPTPLRVKEPTVAKSVYGLAISLTEEGMDRLCRELAEEEAITARD
jgi:hypothetical protein